MPELSFSINSYFVFLAFPSLLLPIPPSTYVFIEISLSSFFQAKKPSSLSPLKWPLYLFQFDFIFFFEHRCPGLHTEFHMKSYHDPVKHFLISTRDALWCKVVKLTWSELLSSFRTIGLEIPNESKDLLMCLLCLWQWVTKSVNHPLSGQSCSAEHGRNKIISWLFLWWVYILMR